MPQGEPEEPCLAALVGPRLIDNRENESDQGHQGQVDAHHGVAAAACHRRDALGVTHPGEKLGQDEGGDQRQHEAGPGGKVGDVVELLE